MCALLESELEGGKGACVCMYMFSCHVCLRVSVCVYKLCIFFSLCEFLCVYVCMCKCLYCVSICLLACVLLSVCCLHDISVCLCEHVMSVCVCT